MKLLASAAAVGLMMGWASNGWCQATTGHVDWNGFSFDWAIENNAGVSIKNVYANGTQYIHSMSMPVIRVQYDNNGCGPYMDRISPNFINQLNGSYVRIGTTAGGELQVWIDATIASYRLRQYYIFTRTVIFGVTNYIVTARLYSSGLQCQVSHRHHPHWRIDADVAGAGGDEIRETRKDGTTILQPLEFSVDKNWAPGSSYWQIKDIATGRYVQIVPPPDNNADSFATRDFYGRRYNGLEHIPWASNVSGFADQGDLILDSQNLESISNTDVVGWSAAHLNHPASLGAAQWVFVGPNLFLR
jgi:hypothetical protein